MAKKGASGDSDYLWEESDGSDGVDVFDEEDEYQSDPGFDYLLTQDEPPARGEFDAFDENTWDEALTPASKMPWFRSRQAQTLLVASGAALSAIVVSVVLLAFRGSSTGDKPVPAPATTPVTTALATPTSEPPPPPPPPPPEPSTMQQAPAVQWPTARPRQTKAPEIGVTRTPVTRYPISVAPQPRHPRN